MAVWQGYEKLRARHPDRVSYRDKMGDPDSIIGELEAPILALLDRFMGKESSELQELLTRVPTQSSQMREFLASIAAHLSARVIVLGGEIGSGKTYLSEIIHEARKALGLTSGEFRNVTLTQTESRADPNMVRSLLFGYKKGAFAGATQDREGAVGESKDGTILLDEIADFPLDVQGILLRVLNDGSYTRVGEATPRWTKAMFILASHQGLASCTEEGRFREDLYDRVKTLQFRVPSLDERREDVAVLAKSLLREWNDAHGTTMKLGPAVEEALLMMQFPRGGVRHLSNLLRDYVFPKAAQEHASQVSVSHLPPSSDAAPAPRAEPVVVCPEEFAGTKADFNLVCDYLRKCLALVSENPSKKRWKLKDLDDKHGWSKRFGAYVAGHPDAFALVLIRNWKSFEPAARILSCNARVKAALSKAGLL